MSAVERHPQNTSVIQPTSQTGWVFAGVFGLFFGLLIGAIYLVLSEILHNRLDFAELAITKAGDNPPVDVALRLESLRRWQGLSNAALLLASMGGSAALVLSASSAWRSSNRKWLVPRLLGATLIGISCGGIAGASGWLLFRLRPMGDQNLVIASLIQAAVWGLLGLGVGLSLSAPSRARAGHLAPAVMFPAMWGLIGSALLTILFPIAYVGTVAPLDPRSRRIWAAVGGILLAIGAMKSARLRSSSWRSQPESNC